MSLSIQQQIANWTAAAEGLHGDVSNAELESLGKEIAANAESLWEYHKLIEVDAARLLEKSREYAEASKLQKNKSERVKEYLKYALKSNGFTKFKAGALQFSISEARKAVAARPATEADFYAHPSWVKPSLSWAGSPTMEIWNDHPDFVRPEFAWDVAKLKAEGKDELLEYETSTRLTVKIARET